MSLSEIKELVNEAIDLYSDDWRSKDKEQLIEKLDFSEREANIICGIMKLMEDDEEEADRKLMDAYRGIDYEEE